MSPALTNFLFEAANFLLLAGALGWVLFRPIRRALDEEAARHQKLEDEAAAHREEATHLLDQARQARTQDEKAMAAERERTLQQAREEADRLVEGARKAVADERRTWQDEQRAARANEGAALAEVVGRVAASSVERLLLTLDGPSLDRALVRAACQQLRELPPPRRPGGSLVVESARPLDEEASRLLHEALHAAPTVGLDARVVEELGAGVRVTTSAGQIDATAAALARQAAARVRALAAADGARVAGDPGGRHG